MEIISPIVTKNMENKASIIALAISPNGESIATGSPSGRVRLWSRDGKVRFDIAEQDRHGGVSGLDFSKHEKWLAVGFGRGQVKIYRCSDMKIVTETVLSEGDVKVAFSRDGKWLATATGALEVKQGNQIIMWTVDGVKKE